MTTSENQKTRFKAASFALGATLFLTVSKLIIGLMSNSVGVLSEGIHSGLDMLSASVAFFTIREAGKPADHDHPYGHGRIETLSSFLEALLLVPAAIFILYEAYHHWVNPEPMQHTGLALGVIALSLVISFVGYLHNSKAAKKTQSSAIHLNALHFLADAVTCLGVLIGLLLIQWTGLTWIDPLVAVLIAIYIFAISWRQIRKAWEELTDTVLPADEVKKIESVLHAFVGRVIEYHDLKTRRSGVKRFVEFHLIVDGQMTVDQSHDICDEIETAIESLFDEIDVTIHVEPGSKKKGY